MPEISWHSIEGHISRLRELRMLDQTYCVRTEKPQPTMFLETVQGHALYEGNKEYTFERSHIISEEMEAMFCRPRWL